MRRAVSEKTKAFGITLRHMNNEHQPDQRHENSGHLYCRHFLAKQQYSPDDREKALNCKSKDVTPALTPRNMP